MFPSTYEFAINIVQPTNEFAINIVQSTNEFDINIVLQRKYPMICT